MHVADELVEIGPLTPFNYILKGSFYLDLTTDKELPYFEKAYFMDP